MVRILITVLVGGVLSGGLGYLLLPVLRALKAGQSIRELGPTWHNNKAGTPMMGGLMFIGAAILVTAVTIPFVKDYTALYVLGLSLCFGLIGFLDDFFKIKFKRNLGLTSIQKALLQMAVSAIYLYLLYADHQSVHSLCGEAFGAAPACVPALCHVRHGRLCQCCQPD